MGENRLEVVLSVPADTSVSELVSENQRLIEIREPASDNSTDTKASEYMVDETESNQLSRKGDALEQLVSVVVSGSSVQTEPGTDPDEISDDS